MVRVLTAAAIGLVIAMMIVVNSSQSPVAWAQSRGDCGESGCPAGYECCAGLCIPDGEVCCEDGTHGDAEECACCTGCVNDDCVTASTVVCIDDVASDE